MNSTANSSNQSSEFSTFKGTDAATDSTSNADISVPKAKIKKSHCSLQNMSTEIASNAEWSRYIHREK